MATYEPGRWPFISAAVHLERRGTLEMARLLGRQENLPDERDCLHRTLPSGIAAAA
jgi:hypothetical protein